MTDEKARLFLDALEALCLLHEVQISVSGYDGIHLSDKKSNETHLWCNGVKWGAYE